MIAHVTGTGPGASWAIILLLAGLIIGGLMWLADRGTELGDIVRSTDARNEWESQRDHDARHTAWDREFRRGCTVRREQTNRPQDGGAA